MTIDMKAYESTTPESQRGGWLSPAEYQELLEREMLKARIPAERLRGEFLGFCEGLLFWELPKELKEKIKFKIEELKK
jgi:hypothetical protein